MIYIEEAQTGDAEKIIDIRRQAYTDEDNRFGCKNGLCLSYIGDKKFIYWCMNRYLLYKIMLDDIVIGSFWLDHETDDRPSHFELQDFCILPQYHNKGYGKAVIDIMEKTHSDIKIWSLSTPIFSIRNQHLYEKMGYKKVEEKQESIKYEKYINI